MNMSNQYIIQPDLTFIDEVVSLGGDTLKKCFQCATCSVACPIAPENSPFPRKEMIAASWGLKDKLVGSADIWLCHECGDCTALCPRGAKPGSTLSAIRSYAIGEYSSSAPVVGKLAKMVTDPKKLALLTAIPAAWLALMAFITLFLGGTMEKIFKVVGVHWVHHTEAPIAQARFISSWLVDFTFVPVFTASILVFVYTLNKMLKDMHANALAEGKTDKETLDLKAYAKTIPEVLKKVLKHTQFNECGENRSRGTAHMMVLYGFIGCFIVTSIGFFFLYVLGVPGPYSQLWPFKWLGNISGIAIVLGAALMIKERLGKSADLSAYKDWYLLGLVIALGATGLLTQMARLAGMQTMTYLIYYIHLICVFHLFAYLPFSKIAHAVYRLAAMTYAEYANRK
jgi:quinone-modifying oxidoreductase subunit QmoC